MGHIQPGVHSLRAGRGKLGKDGNKYMPVYVSAEANGILRLQFGYDLYLKDEIKAMEGARWSPEGKTWMISDSARNAFAFKYLSEAGPNPYAKYDLEYPPINTDRPLYQYQKMGAGRILGVRQTLLAWEMGTGKTLTTMEAMERAKPNWPIYIAPKFALQNIRREFRMWDTKVMPEFMSYDQMKAMMVGWTSGKKAPDFIVLDECHQVMHATSQRSQYTKNLADGSRSDWGEPFIVGLTGTPAPKDPTNWWSICEIICPGFLKEGNVAKLRYNLAVIKKKETMAGGSYPELICWLDDPRKCKECGQTYDHVNHTAMAIEPHQFVPSQNEIDRLYRRLKGLVAIQLKKDCLDLPDKIYRVVQCDPTPAALRAIKMLKSRCSTAIELLTYTRELSDGFQYVTQDSGQKEVCQVCHGTKVCKTPSLVEDVPALEDQVTGDSQRNISVDLPMIEVACTGCKGTGLSNKMERIVKEVPCPKEDALLELLEEQEEVGRIVIYSGFTASVDRICRFLVTHNWDVIRVDGRGSWSSFDIGDVNKCMVCGKGEQAGEHMLQNPAYHAYCPPSVLEYFQDKSRRIPKIGFVGQPGAAGVSITLTEACMTVYYSNTFNGKDRMQSEDRIHRIGMDQNRGATIVDLYHLPTDRYVADNLKKKKDLQAMSLGDITTYLDTAILEEN